MGIGRVLVIGLVIWLAYFIYRRLKASSNLTKAYRKKTKVSSVKQCAVCDVHVPEDEAIKQDNLYYCSQAHANKNNG